MTEWILNNLLLTAGGAGAVIFILGRIVPNDKLLGAGISTGKIITATGRRILGKAFWERAETELKSCGGVYLKGILKGLESDDKENSK